MIPLILILVTADIERGCKRVRRFYVALVAGVMAVVAIIDLWSAGWVPSRVLVFTYLALVTIMLWLIRRQRRGRVRDLLIVSEFTGADTGPRFAAPATSAAHALPAIIPAIPVMVIGRAVLDGPMSALKITWFVVAHVLVAAWLLMWPMLVRRLRASRLDLRPSGLRVPTMLGSFLVDWDALTEASAGRHGIVLRFPAQAARDAAGQTLGTRIMATVTLWVVDPRWLAAVIEHYRTHAEARGAIGTAAELTRLKDGLATPPPAPPRSAKSAL